MVGALITLRSVPEIGFAHHFYAEHYDYRYFREQKKSFEIVYVKSGAIEAELYEDRFVIQPGSIFVLFRHLPFHLRSVDNTPQAHCSVQFVADYDFSLLETDALPEGLAGIVLPFVLPPCAEAEEIRRELYTIISEIGVSREENAGACSLAAMGLLARLNRVYRKNLVHGKSNASVLCYRIKKYVAGHIHQPIPLLDIATELGKTPNYLNAVFKAENGITLCQYINREKANFIAELIRNKGVSFETACSNAGISDLSYGYRFFKKYIGETPREYLAADHFRLR